MRITRNRLGWTAAAVCLWGLATGVATAQTPSCQVTYTWTLGAGQTLNAATLRTFAAQMGGNGTAHATTGDTYTVNYTVGGVARTQTGSF